MEDAGIIELLFRRSEAAIGELERKYGAGCRRIAGNILGDFRDTEECVNDTYLGVWSSVPPKEPDPLQAYIYRIARNLAVKRLRGNTAQKRRSQYDAALDELSARELSGLLDSFLDSLPDGDRYLFVRRYWYSDPVDELAKESHATPNSLYVRLHRIREKLRKYLISEGIEI